MVARLEVVASMFVTTLVCAVSTPTMLWRDHWDLHKVPIILLTCVPRLTMSPASPLLMVSNLCSVLSFYTCRELLTYCRLLQLVMESQMVS